MDCGADLISYGMGERSILEIAQALDGGIDVKDITYVAGTCFKTKQIETVYDCEMLPSYEEIREDKKRFAESFYRQYCSTDPFSGKRLAERYGTVYVVQNPPAKPLRWMRCTACPTAGPGIHPTIRRGACPLCLR